MFNRTARARDALPTRALQIEVRAAQKLKDVQLIGAQDPYVSATLCSGAPPFGLSTATVNGTDVNAEREMACAAMDEVGERREVRVVSRYAASGGTSPVWTASHRNRLLLVPKEGDTAVLVEVWNRTFNARQVSPWDWRVEASAFPASRSSATVR